MNVLVADKLEQSGLDALAAMGCRVINDAAVKAEEVGAAVARAEAQVLIVRSKKVQAPAIGAARGLRGIVRAGAGVDNIDVAAASKARVAVCNCPGMNAVAVAELAMGLLLCCDRRIPQQTADALAGRWNKKEYARARGLKGRTLGIVGVGSIGSAVARRALAFEMRVIGCSIPFTPPMAAALGVECGGETRADILRMLPRCDAVTVHVAGGPDTRHLCDAEFFAAMKPGAYFINTSRGAVVDEAALKKAAGEKGLRFALDVYADEPAAPEGPWSCAVREGAAALTHHCGASTDEAQEAVAAETVRIVRVFKETGRWENCVNAGELR